MEMQDKAQSNAGGGAARDSSIMDSASVGMKIGIYW